jgi:hypothetical protein
MATPEINSLSCNYAKFRAILQVLLPDKFSQGEARWLARLCEGTQAVGEETP